MRNAWMLGVVFIALTACQSGSADQPEKSVEEIMAGPKIGNSAIIRNPASADQVKDTINVARMTFERDSFDFGEVLEGTMVEHTYSFVNTGKVPLLINDARSTCGCTVPDWPRDPIAPGAGGEIKVRFNTEGKQNVQLKPISIVANTYPSTSKVVLTGFVRPKGDKKTGR